MSFESRDLFKFREIGDNILLTVQEKDSCNGRLIGNRVWSIEWQHVPMPLNDLEGHFC